MTNKNLHSERAIAGRSLISYVRSAFAFGDDVFIKKFGINDNTPIKAKIISFRDESLRDINAQRTIELLLTSTPGTKNIKLGDKTTVTILDKSYRIDLDCIVENCINENLTLSLPSEGKQKVTRVDSRILLENQPWCDGLIQSGEFKIACVFKVDNYSESGIGISLVSPIELKTLGEPFTIQSNYRNNNFEFIGPYNLIRYKCVESGEGIFKYEAGLENNWPKENTVGRASRFDSVLFLNLTVNLSGVNVQAQVKDISFSGFKASINSNHLHKFVKGIIVTEQTSSLQFVVIRKSESEIAFKLISGEVSDRIKWANKMVPSISNGKIDVTVSDSRDLLNLFFEAGATIADGLSYNRYGLTKDESLTVLTEQSDVVIRWVNVATNGTVLAHHSTYRVGINSWYTGDVAGGQNDQNRAEDNFFNNNFKFLREIVETFPTTQKILGSWKPNHPYWQKWRNYLIDNKLVYSMLNCDTISRRQIACYISNEKIEARKASISSLDPYQIFNIFETFDRNTRWFLGALDVSQTDQYFDGLKSVYSETSGGIKKCCCLVKFDNIDFFVLFSQFPDGITINPNFDSAFIFPINDQQIEQKILDDLYSYIIVSSSKMGYRISTIRHFTNVNPAIGILTEFFVTDSKGLGIYE